MLPQDPVILMSYLNTQLRDHYTSLEALAEGLDLSQEDLTSALDRLAQAGITYDESNNSFR